jgi:adenine-specific DNA-methyltransferase
VNVAVLDNIRFEANARLDPSNKSKLGQFMTPAVIAEFMSKFFNETSSPISLLDCGAGIGSLTISALKHLKNITSVEQWEIDPLMRNYLELNNQKLSIPATVHSNDFIEDAVNNLSFGLGTRFTHAIINPPYKKISSNSTHRLLLRTIGIETVNLYTAFLALTILLMKEKGQIVAIIPRSFCNGPYYKPFRELMLKHCSIENIHVFESRMTTFKDDDVLQENIIIKLVKGKQSSLTKVSCSYDHLLDNVDELTFPFERIVKPNDKERFIHIPSDMLDVEDNPLFKETLSNLGLQVSTGPVVDFRIKKYLLDAPTDSSVPMLYPHHFINGEIEYPKVHRKADAVEFHEDIKKSFWETGYYVLVKRFSAKEEKRRVVAYLINPDAINSNLLAFENGWNVIHIDKQGFDPILAKGLVCFLNSSILDIYFRVFSGHTQVNATDLRNMRFPTTAQLIKLGEAYSVGMPQSQVDQLVEKLK